MVTKLKKSVGKYLQFYKDKYWFLIKRYTQEILLSDKSDHMISVSYALGTMIAVFPTPGFSTAIGLGLLAIFKKLNKIAVLLSMMVWNAVTVLPIYWLSFKIGKRIATSLPNIDFGIEWLNTFLLYLKQFALGNLVITIPISFGSYFLAMLLLKLARRMRLRKTENRNNLRIN